jgi:hypothetical protein
VKHDIQQGEDLCRAVENNIKMDPKEIGWHGLNSSGSGQGQVVNSSENNNEPLGCIRGRESLDYIKQLLASRDSFCSVEL